jgi:hypothetical protein
MMDLFYSSALVEFFIGESHPPCPTLYLCYFPYLPISEPSSTNAGAYLYTLAASPVARPTTGVLWPVDSGVIYFLDSLMKESFAESLDFHLAFLYDGSLRECIKFTSEARGFFSGATTASLEDARNLVCNRIATPSSSCLNIHGLPTVCLSLLAHAEERHGCLVWVTASVDCFTFFVPCGIKFYLN